jgi:hypothetical protein
MLDFVQLGCAIEQSVAGQPQASFLSLRKWQSWFEGTQIMAKESCVSGLKF